MIIKLPKSLPYPVTIEKLLHNLDEDIERHRPLIAYSYKIKCIEYPEYGVERHVQRQLSDQYNVPIAGKLTRWLISVGTIVDSSSVGICEVEEPCTHEIQFSGLCAVCGEDMTIADYATYTSIKEVGRSQVHVSYDNTGLTISRNEAQRQEEESKRRLLKQRKLSLVVDLDQTIIQATVDPTAKSWQDDPTCINHEYVKDLQWFTLDEHCTGGNGTPYFIKMRPGLKGFLEHVAKLYELHIYTMGTRAYALKVKQIVDPTGTLFGERVLSRDESGSSGKKDLYRLFPHDTKMVVIIDDRGDVWNWSDHLLKVHPFNFFVGVGDINSPFGPKEEVPVAPAIEASTDAVVVVGDVTEKNDKPAGTDDIVVPGAAAAADESADIAPSKLINPDKLVIVEDDTGVDTQLINEQNLELEKTIEAQKRDRPLARQQELQDKLDEERNKELAVVENGDGAKVDGSARPTRQHTVLGINDNELAYIKVHLTAIHTNFYRLYDQNRGDQKGRVQQLKKRPGFRKAPEQDGLDLDAVPDVADIMPPLRNHILSECVIAFSGVFPQNIDIHSCDLVVWAESFGASISNKVSRNVTHLVASKPRTAKVKEAARYGHIKIVHIGWLHDVLSQWKWIDETHHLLQIDHKDRHGPEPPEDLSNLLSSEGDETDEYDSEIPPSSQPGGEDAVLDMSNIGWKDVDEEFDEFFGDENLDSDTESVQSDKSERTDIEVVKRKREGKDPEVLSNEMEIDDSDESSSGSRLAKRQKVTRERAGSTLKAVQGAMRSATNGEDDASDDERTFDSEDELARELDAELMTQASDDDGGSGDES